MNNLIKTAALSTLIGLGALGVAPASAQGVYLGLGGGHHGPSVGVWMGDGGHSYRRYEERDYGDRYHSGYHDRYRPHRPNYGPACSPNQAMNKAERMGIRRARIQDVSRRVIEVAGRSRGDRVVVTFARAPGCPVIGHY